MCLHNMCASKRNRLSHSAILVDTSIYWCSTLVHHVANNLCGAATFDRFWRYKLAKYTLKLIIWSCRQCGLLWSRRGIVLSWRLSSVYLYCLTNGPPYSLESGLFRSAEPSSHQLPCGNEPKYTPWHPQLLRITNIIPDIHHQQCHCSISGEQLDCQGAELQFFIPELKSGLWKLRGFQILRCCRYVLN
jgi:hypothetical protein